MMLFLSNKIIKQVNHMRTTVKIDDSVAKELLDISKKKTLPKAIQEAVQEYIRMKRKQELLDLAGKIDLDIDLDELRNRELKEFDNR